MIDLTKLSSHYIVRELGKADVDKVLEICQGNPQFYEYTEAEPTREQILADMKGMFFLLIFWGVCMKLFLTGWNYCICSSVKI